MPCPPSQKGCANCSCAPAPASASGPTSGAAVSLPRRQGGTTNESTPLLWPTTDGNTAGNASENYQSTERQQGEEPCAVVAQGGAGTVCCRTHQEEERTLIDPDLARDCIVGLSDGLTVPFALTAGLSSVGSSRLVVLAGLAELVSGAISMGIGGFLSAQAELQHFHYHERATQARLLRSCDGEIDRQVEEILTDYGVERDTCRRVARELRRKEDQRVQRRLQVQARKEREKSARRRKVFGVLPLPSSAVGAAPTPTRRRGDEESLAAPSASNTANVDNHDHDEDEDEDEDQVGLTPFLLRVGSGLEPVSTSRLYISALTIGTSYFVGGAIPLLPYVFIPDAAQALLVSIVVTGVILLVFGVVKQRVTGGEGGVRGYLYGALSTLAVGGVAAGASWAIVSALERGGD
ncbi:related to CCC1 - Proposed vacuolar iron transport protein [Pseudozyma flocculosa]|nr:related to CCC1 - Proposed vacuolar iron transport protein [Pseudozyma flocculosa]